MRNLNAHRLLAGTTTYQGYLDALTVSRTEQTALRAARDMARVAIKAGLQALQSEGVNSILDERFIAKAASMPPLVPRFKMQGSMKYRTLNEPAHMPPQEIDVDDGVYLPTSFVTANGKARPMLASKAYFRAVEKTLEPLCRQKGWVLDKSKPCCVRIRISDKAHIDMPLYAIPDQEFAQLAEDRALAKADSQSAFLEISDDAYRQLPSDQVMLARRNDEWLESDPRQIEDWLLEAIAEHGEIVRDVSRYLKGWRDHHWQRCKISSILLMSCVVDTFDGIKGTLSPDRDDLALLAVAKNLAAQFQRNMPNPVLPDQILNEAWTMTERVEFVRMAEDFHREVDAALNLTYEKGVAIRHLQAALGPRVPNNPDLILIDGKEAAVMSYPRARVAPPVVPRTTSG